MNILQNEREIDGKTKEIHDQQEGQERKNNGGEKVEKHNMEKTIKEVII